MNLIQALLGTVFPVFVLAALGWAARRYLQIELRDPARLALYVMVPGLVMHSILNTQMAPSEVGKIIAYSLLLCGVMVLLTLGAGRALGWERSVSSAAVLATAFMNAANYGLPVVLLAFGEAGFERGTIFVVMQSLLMFTVGVFFAARGRANWRHAMAEVFRLPLVWAAAVALVVRLLGIPVPEPVLRPLALLANGALVLMVLLLGMQVAGIAVRGAWLKIALSSLIRLALSPLVGLVLVWLLRPEPLTGRVLVLLSAMPTAVNTTLLAVQYQAEPDMVSGATMVTTLISIVTVTFWVWRLQSLF